MDWTQQGPAVVGVVPLTDGREGKIVLLGHRANPRGAMVVLAKDSDAAVETRPLADSLDLIPPRAVAEALCMQERLYGAVGLKPPDLS